MSVVSLTISFGGQSVLLEYPADWDAELRLLFGPLAQSHPEPCAQFCLAEDKDGRFDIHEDCELAIRVINRDNVSIHISEFVTHRLAKTICSGVALHGGVIGWAGHSVLIPGHTGAGKSSLVAWFVEEGFDFLTDELAVLAPDGVLVQGFPRALMLKETAINRLSQSTRLHNVRIGTRQILLPTVSAAAPHESLPCRLMIFPSYLSGAALKIEPIRAVDAAMRLMTHNTNASNLADGGLAAIAKLVRRAPALELRYGDFSQLAGVIDTLTKLVLVSEPPLDRIGHLISALTNSQSKCVREDG